METKSTANHGETGMNSGIVIRSRTTGKYHMGYTNSSITFCNYSGQVRQNRVRPATDDETTKAQPASFCRKCFPNGKP